MLSSLVHHLDLDDQADFELDLRVEELTQRAVLLTDCGTTVSNVFALANR